MRISGSKSEAMVFIQKRVDCPLQVRGESLPKVEKVKYLRVRGKRSGKLRNELEQHQQ